MHIPHLLNRLAIISIVFGTTAICTQAQQPQNQDPDIIRVTTSLVQTDVMVFDKQGKFVDNLKREQFVLKVNGKPREISFFELVKAGSANEEAQLAAARGLASTRGAPVPLDRGRSLFFFIDDIHLSEESMHQTRKMLAQFVERQMSQNDQVAFISASGQIGFLQQLTDNKTVLSKAIERLRPRPFKTRDIQYPPMSEHQALRIEIGDRDVLNVFVEQVMRENPMISRAQAEEEVKARANGILRIAAVGTKNTLGSLQWVMEKFRSAPGRKVMFLLSDGFLLDSRNSDNYARLSDVTAAAAASTFVIYSIDARGLVTGTPDAGTPVMFDPSGRLSRGTMGETQSSQDGLNALANDTGGKAFFNSNALSTLVSKGLDDASVYYLLAWRPEPNEERNPKQRRLEISVLERPELSVRSRSNIGDTTTEVVKKKGTDTPAPANRTNEIRSALQAQFPKPGFPVETTLNFINTVPKGDVLITSIRLAPTQLKFEKAAVPTANILLNGLVLDEEGKVVDSFNKRVIVQAKSEQNPTPPADITYTAYSAVKPGLYQVRVVAADQSGGPTGSVWDWIEIPDFSQKKLALSSLLVGERKTEPVQNTSQSPEPIDPVLKQVNLNVNRRFSSSSYLRFLTIIYNAASPPAGSTQSAKPDLAVQVQLFRDDEPVVTDPLHSISTDGATDLARISYAAELKLNGLSPGKYVLQLTIIDRIAKASTSQRVRFQVD